MGGATCADTLQQLQRNTEYVGYATSAGRVFDDLDAAESKFNEVSRLALSRARHEPGCLSSTAIVTSFPSGSREQRPVRCYQVRGEASSPLAHGSPGVRRCRLTSGASSRRRRSPTWTGAPPARPPPPASRPVRLARGTASVRGGDARSSTPAPTRPAPGPGVLSCTRAPRRLADDKDLDQWICITLLLAVEREIKLPKVQTVWELKQVRSGATRHHDRAGEGVQDPPAIPPLQFCASGDGWR